MEKVPYLFSWFVPGKVAGMARPKNNQMNYLAQGGITVLVNLTREPSEYENDAKTVGITCVNISIADYYSPTVAQVIEYTYFNGAADIIVNNYGDIVRSKN